MQEDTFVIYANAVSLWDHTNGASKSIKLLLESLAQAGCHVTAIMGCTSDCEEGFKTSQRIWLDQSSGREERHKTKSIKCNGVNYSLIATEHWSRKYLAADEQEQIYRLSQKAIKEGSKHYTKKIFIGWGNLLLEEAIFKEAKKSDYTLLFYLANPSYFGKNTETLRLTDKIITDSFATKELYLGEPGLPNIHVIPKCVEPPEFITEASLNWEAQTILFVNPKLKKGLEALISIAIILEERKPNVKIKIIDAGNQMPGQLKMLGAAIDDLPKNILIESGQANADEVFKDVTVLLLLSLWHESGSRLIHESHLRGVPALAFRTGGSAELIGKIDQDLFDKPSTKDINGQPKIQNWNPEKLINRIIELTSDFNLYAKHSGALLKRADELICNNSLAAEEILRACEDSA